MYVDANPRARFEFTENAENAFVVCIYLPAFLSRARVDLISNGPVLSRALSSAFGSSVHLFLCGSPGAGSGEAKQRGEA